MVKKTFDFRKELYSKESLIKAAYSFIDDYYLHLDADDQYFFVTLTPRTRGKSFVDYSEFENEMLIQETRKLVLERTGNLREIMYSRAMASTILSDVGMESTEEDEDADTILMDWFEKNEE